LEGCSRYCLDKAGFGAVVHVFPDIGDRDRRSWVTAVIKHRLSQ
jgi:hypothetical protein